MWYYASGSERVGPLDEAAFRNAVGTGVVSEQTLVWREGMAEWQPWGRVRSQAAAPMAAGVASGGGQAQCVECGQVFPASEMITYQGQHICPSCKPIFFQRLQEGGRLPGRFVYAGFWIRFVAKMVDGIVLMVVNVVLQIATGTFAPADPNEAGPMIALVTLLLLAINLGYFVFFNGRYGATPGKMAVGIKIVRPDGSSISYMRALGRTFAEWLSGLILYIGYIMAAFDEEKRSLHDRICDTRVIKA